MNAERLLQYFECISEVPGVIPRLRSFILDLAVRGKLVEQDPNDEPATALLCELREAKERLQKEENIRGRQPVPRTESSELGFPVPDSWEFPAFDDVFVIVSGVTKGRNLAGRKTIEVPYLRVANVQRGYLDLSVMKTIHIPEDELPRYALRRGDILMTEGGDWDKLGRAAIWVGEMAQCIHQNHVFRVRSPLPEKLYPEWVVTYTNSLLGRSYFENAAKQTTNLASINMTQLRGCPIPLPPLAEQHRIVSKVDELMGLCDQLEAAQTAREQSRGRLVASSLHRLNSPADTAETDTPNLPARRADAFRNHARFVFEILPRLTTHPDHIKQLRQTILNLAVRGKLVPQDPNDEPAAELFKRIQAEKVRMVKDGKIRGPGPLQPVNNATLPFAVPKHWVWLQLREIGILSGGMTPSKNRSDYWEGEINWFSPKDIKSDQLVESELKITSAGVAETGLQLYPVGCLFMVARSGILKRTFPVSINRVKATVNQDLKVLNPFIEGLERYLQIMFRGMTDFILSALVKTGTTVQSLKYEEFEIQLLPLPPLAEQHRIVARVDELMALCDQIEAQLIATEADSRLLLEAVLHEALNPPLAATEQMKLEANA